MKRKNEKKIRESKRKKWKEKKERQISKNVGYLNFESKKDRAQK
jgi:hypothetical protein